MDPLKGGHFAIRVVTHRKKHKKSRPAPTDATTTTTTTTTTTDPLINDTNSDVSTDAEHFAETGSKSNATINMPECSTDDDENKNHVKHRSKQLYAKTPRGIPANVVHKQLYHSESNILVTRFLAKTGVAHVRDYMPVGASTQYAQGWIVRQIEVVRGAMCFEVDCAPAFNYARDKHTVECTNIGAKFTSDKYTFILTSSVPRQWISHCDGSVVCRLRLKEGEKEVFVFKSIGRQRDTKTGTELVELNSNNEIEPLSIESTDELEAATIRYWRAWLSRCTYTGRWREYIHRSALILKLLTFEPTGSMVSAPTTSLPELTGGSRNHDYRYTWLRDSAFVIYAFIKLGFYDEARAFIKWSQNILRDVKCSHTASTLQAMYGLHGEREIEEIELDNLCGYRNSYPVRVGNTSYKQFQLDIYGVALDTIYLSSKYAQPISWDGWQNLRNIVDWVCDNWKEADHSIWGHHYAQQSEQPSQVQDELTGSRNGSLNGIGKYEQSSMKRSDKLDGDIESRAIEKKQHEQYRIEAEQAAKVNEQRQKWSSMWEPKNSTADTNSADKSISDKLLETLHLKQTNDTNTHKHTHNDNEKTKNCRECNNNYDQYDLANDTDRQQYTYSKMMCWVAVDRGIRIAQKRSLPADLAKWLYARNAIYEYVVDQCWSDTRQAFVQSAGSDKLDASLMLMSSFFFLTPTDPRFVSTLESIFQSASKGGLVSNNLVYRYSSSDVVDSATYSVCTFWAVEAAARLGMFDPVWLERARLMFEQMLGYSNHLRLFSEQVGLRGEHIGNFPHAFTHLSLISAAVNLDRALSGSQEPYLTKT